jgi:glycosyltransferase involved in cell wall biosynthesis
MLPYGVNVPRTLDRRYQVAPLRLVYAGRVTQLQKRVTDFVPLVKHLLQANVPFTFDIIGEGDHYSSLKDEMNDRFPSGLVHFHPRLPHREMPGIWSGHDVFLQVSDFEGTSVSMLEAMAHGVVPIVTAASSGISGVIHSRENGFVVPVGDMAAMAQVLARLASDQSLLAAIGRAAHQMAKEYSLESYGRRFIEFLDDVLEVGHHVDVYQRYGMFGAAHPLFKQSQLIMHQQEQIIQLQQGALQRLLGRKLGNFVPAKVRRLLRSKSA